MGKQLEQCAECGMSVEDGEYHPFAACLMFKACKDSETVRANLDSVIEKAGFDARRNEKEKFHRGLKKLQSDAGSTSELNGIIQATNYVWAHGV